MTRRSRKSGLVLAVIGLLVILTFLVRRTGMLPGDGPAFEPADFRDAPTVSAADAASVVGMRAVVCGPVVATNFAREVGGRPTYLNLERPFPNQPFDAVIWGRHRERFPTPPEVAYRNRNICVAGRVTTHRDTPRIEVSTPAQITVRADPPEISPPSSP